VAAQNALLFLVLWEVMALSSFFLVTYEHKEGIMAKPIKETPILYGKDAQKFEKKITLNKVNTAPKSEYDRVMKNYNKIKEKMQKV
ncbi:MAG: hypothetical protein NTV01_20495, partial [Bacteroidia bacterium]|nr:hypothetical protein [Bacteroidia bacterium]